MKFNHFFLSNLHLTLMHLARVNSINRIYENATARARMPPVVWYLNWNTTWIRMDASDFKLMLSMSLSLSSIPSTWLYFSIHVQSSTRSIVLSSSVFWVNTDLFTFQLWTVISMDLGNWDHDRKNVAEVNATWKWPFPSVRQQYL